jgi:hypothetical protein
MLDTVAAPAGPAKVPAKICGQPDVLCATPKPVDDLLWRPAGTGRRIVLADMPPHCWLRVAT